MNRLSRFTPMAVMAFAVTFAAVIGTRIEERTLSVLAGTALGFLAAGALVGTLAYWLGRRHVAPREAAMPFAPVRYMSPMPQTPPNVVWGMSHSQPGMQYGTPGYSAAPWGYGPQQIAAPPLQLAPRRFFMIGTSGEVQELSEVMDEQERQQF